MHKDVREKKKDKPSSWWKRGLWSIKKEYKEH